MLPRDRIAPPRGLLERARVENVLEFGLFHGVLDESETVRDQRFVEGFVDLALGFPLPDLLLHVHYERGRRLGL